MNIIDLKNEKEILVISGGGIKGLTSLGCITKLKELQIINNIKVYSGTSVGAAICLGLLIGYDSQQLYQIFYEVDQELLVQYDDNIIDDSCFGISTSTGFMNLMTILLKKKDIDSNITFKKLYELIPKKIIITGVCLNDLSLHYFDYERTPDMSVLLAIQISTSLPILLKPVIYNNKIWIDGGSLNDYPINLFDNELEKVIGIYTQNDYNTTIHEFENKFTYVYQLLNCMYKCMSDYKLDIYSKNTIKIVVESGKSNLSSFAKEDKERLYYLGYNFSYTLINNDK
jgi:predicted acylesterase/phospholipase RssA